MMVEFKKKKTKVHARIPLSYKFKLNKILAQDIGKTATESFIDLIDREYNEYFQKGEQHAKNKDN